MKKNTEGKLVPSVSINSYKSRPKLVHSRDVGVLVTFCIVAIVLILAIVCFLRSKGDSGKVIGEANIESDTQFNSN